MIADDFYSFPWSQEISTRQRASGLVHLHNYTIYTDRDGMQRTRWLKREFVPHSKRYGAITERGFGLRPRPGGTGQRNFPWPSASRFCPAVIPLCFNTNADAVVLADSLTAAINSWHQGLGVGEPGNHAGVRFAITQPRVCSGYAIGAADYRVHVVDISTEAMDGCRVLPKHHLLFTIH